MLLNLSTKSKRACRHALEMKGARGTGLSVEPPTLPSVAPLARSAFRGDCYSVSTPRAVMRCDTAGNGVTSSSPITIASFTHASPMATPAASRA